MKKIILVSLLALSLASCKEEKKTQVPAPRPVAAVIDIDELAKKSITSKDDWSKDLSIYIDDINTCVKSVKGQTKYVFHADAFENPPIALILLKTEGDKVFACSFNENDTVPHFKEIHLDTPKNAPRFYPGELPKADSCLINTRVLDKSGHIAGWLAKISC